MKPISEYNFREIVGKYVRFKITDPSIIDPNYDEFMAFCYADIDQGISLNVWGGIKNNEFYISHNCGVTLRYSDDIVLDMYEMTDENIMQYDLAVYERHTPYWIEKIREDTDYDLFRSKQFPDDLLLPTQTIINNENVGESIWIRPCRIKEDCLIGRTIEEGNIIHINEEVFIFKNLKDDRFPIIAVTNSWLNYLNQNKGGTNEE